MDDGWLLAEAGGCRAWPLAAEATCARAARRAFRRTASTLGLDAEAVDDGELIVSELAANTLHAAAQGGRPGACELWLYLRGSGAQCQLVCKVFDAAPGWRRGVPPRGGRQAPADALGGRGLEVVDELSQGRWGYHLTRSRLRGWGLPGKAVWFTLPAPYARKPRLDRAGASAVASSELAGSRAAGRPAQGGPAQGGPAQGGPAQGGPAQGGPAQGGWPSATARDAVARLEAELAARGITVPGPQEAGPGTFALALCGEVTVWCRPGSAWLRGPGLDGQRWGYEDLTEVAEQAVEAHERFCERPLERAHA